MVISGGMIGGALVLSAAPPGELEPVGAPPGEFDVVRAPPGEFDPAEPPVIEPPGAVESRVQGTGIGSEFGYGYGGGVMVRVTGG